MENSFIFSGDLKSMYYIYLNKHNQLSLNQLNYENQVMWLVHFGTMPICSL